MKFYCKKYWPWALIIVVLIVLWLWAAWLRGWFPFLYRAVPPVTQAELNSLTATGTPAVVSASTLKALTATSSKSAAVSAPVLDSLSAKK